MTEPPDTECIGLLCTAEEPCHACQTELDAAEVEEALEGPLKTTLDGMVAKAGKLTEAEARRFIDYLNNTTILLTRNPDQIVPGPEHGTTRSQSTPRGDPE